MQYVKLGNTNIEVSRLCFGGLTIGHLQANLSVEHGSDIILKALESGVNFINVKKLKRIYNAG